MQQPASTRGGKAIRMRNGKAPRAIPATHVIMHAVSGAFACACAGLFLCGAAQAGLVEPPPSAAWPDLAVAGFYLLALSACGSGISGFILESVMATGPGR